MYEPATREDMRNAMARAHKMRAQAFFKLFGQKRRKDGAR